MTVVPTATPRRRLGILPVHREHKNRQGFRLGLMFRSNARLAPSYLYLRLRHSSPFPRMIGERHGDAVFQRRMGQGLVGRQA